LARELLLDGLSIVAPATNIVTLENTAGGHPITGLRDGTSFSAPYVAGVAGLLLAMDSTLTAADLKDYILRGARQLASTDKPACSGHRNP